jgi:hypothetical protein
VYQKFICKKVLKKGKDIPVAVRGGPQGCVTSRPAHFLDNRFTNGGEVVSLMHGPHLYPQEDLWYSLLLEAELTQELEG